MDIPVAPMKHSAVALALVAQALETFDGGTPTQGLIPKLDEINEAGEVPDLIAALIYLAASLAHVAASGKPGVNPEDILVTLYPDAQGS